MRRCRFSFDPPYLHLDYFLENLNKEDFLKKSLYQASILDGSKTQTELLFAIQDIYHIRRQSAPEVDFSSHKIEVPSITLNSHKSAMFAEKAYQASAEGDSDFFEIKTLGNVSHFIPQAALKEVAQIILEFFSDSDVSDNRL